MSINRTNPLEAPAASNLRFMTQQIVRLAMTALVAGGLGAAALGLAQAAYARPNPACNDMAPCYTWCPGDPLPNSNQPISWDMNVCHDWYYGGAGFRQVIEGIPPSRPIPPLWVP
jgi:hypothetical protein